MYTYLVSNLRAWGTWLARRSGSRFSPIRSKFGSADHAAGEGVSLSLREPPRDPTVVPADPTELFNTSPTRAAI